MHLLPTYAKRFAIFIFTVTVCSMFANPLFAQELDPQPQDDSIISLRSDVGIVGLTANLDWWNKFNYMGSDTLAYDDNHEIEIVFRDVRMMTQKLGVGFMLLGSFYLNESGFSLAGWGVGPVVRYYPFKTDRFLPYIQGQALLGNMMGLGDLSDTVNEANGFRMRLGLKAGLGIRVTNNFGFFVEFGPAWESDRLFRADSRVWQFNIGIDIYRFKH